MATILYFLIPFTFLSKVLLKKIYNLLHFHRVCNFHVAQPKILTHPSLDHKTEELADQTLIFHMEESVLKSSSIFPYFMLVAFEAGGFLRALTLLILYPFVCLVGEELGMKIMVFVSFVGIKEKSFSIGRTVLPKFFLEDVGKEGFDVVMRCGRKIGVSAFPRVMIDGFLRDQLGVDAVVGRELKVVWGYFVGLMEDNKVCSNVLDEIVMEEKMGSAIGIGCINKFLNHQSISHCKAVYLVSEDEKRNWKTLPREKYPKPLIFHDGRLAFRPTPLATLAMFMWIPFGLFLAIIRSIIVFLFPYKLATPIYYFLGIGGVMSTHHSHKITGNIEKRSCGTLYVCNHRTLLDAIYVSGILLKPLTAVTYSLSRVSEVFSPIKTARLTRNREKDSEIMEKLLSQGDVVIFPEGTTCREPYLLRFSPLFVEKSDEIVPIGIDIQVSMFYGTTASGFKCLDPIFYLMNPIVICNTFVLEKLPEAWKEGKSKFEVANHIQAQIANALRFECTSLTRRDKYMALAGNEGVI